MIVLILFSLLLGVFGAEIAELGDDDFAVELSRNEHTLVLFYAPWCGHCKRFRPELEAAAGALARLEPPVGVAAVDCTARGLQTCERYELGGYPTVKVFRRAAALEDYGGQRTAADMVEHVRRLVGPGSIELRDEGHLQGLVGGAKVVTVVGYFASELGLKRWFLGLVKVARSKAEFAHFQGAEEPERVVLYRPGYLENAFDRSVVPYEGDGSDLGEFLAKNYHGLVGHRKATNKDDFNPPSLIAYFEVDYVRKPKITNYWRNRIAKVAANYTGRLVFAFSSNEEFSDEMNNLGSNYVATEDPVIVANSNDTKKYVMTDKFSIPNLGEFVHNFLEGKLEAFVKSQPIPASNDGFVKVAVAKNFNEVVVGNGKDTLIEFYAPWCGYCKKLATIYEELGKKLAGEDVVLVKMDATANDIPGSYKLRGYPAIYWLPKDYKDDPVEYVGGRTVDDFLEYVAKYSTEELKGYDREGAAKDQQDEL